MTVHFTSPYFTSSRPVLRPMPSQRLASPVKFGNSSEQPAEPADHSIHLLRALGSLLKGLLPKRELPRPSQRLTSVEHESDFQFYAPHHFKVRSVETGEVIAEVDFQEGPVKAHGLNGVQNEDLLEMVIARLRGFQNSPFASAENADALQKTEEALALLNARTARREKRGVEGTNQR